jgi:hypothetical protein
MMLVVFALLLVWMGAIPSEHKNDRPSEASRKQSGKSTEPVKPLGETPSGRSNGNNEFGDSFHELELTDGEGLAAAQSVEALRELGKRVGANGISPEQMVQAISERIRVADKFIHAAGASPELAKNNPTDQQLADTVETLARIREELTSAGLSTNDAAILAQSAKLLRQLGKDAGVIGASPERIAEAVSQRIHIADKFIQVAKLKGTSQNLRTMPKARLKNTEVQARRGGQGTERPACWTDPETGKPEYIFDVAMKTNSLRLRQNEVVERGREGATLPLSEIKFDKDVRFQDFRQMTRALFTWGENEGCRFFVRVFDVTKPHEKGQYKLALRTVGEHFYYYEELGRPWNEENASTAR